MPFELPFNINLGQIPVNDTILFFVYVFLALSALGFLYKYFFKDLVEVLIKNKKDNVKKLEENVCLDDDIENHYFFKIMYKYIRVDLDQIFDINQKKDAQFLLLGKCKYIVFYNTLKNLVHQVLEDKIIINGKIIEYLTSNDLIEIQQKAVDEYNKMYLSMGGNQYILDKFNEYHSQRVAGAAEMINIICSQDYFNKSNKNLMLGLLTVYTYAFIQTFEDLRANHRTINGSIHNEMAKFILTPEFKKNIKNLGV